MRFLPSPCLRTAAAHSCCWHKHVLTSSTTPWDASPAVSEQSSLLDCVCLMAWHIRPTNVRGSTGYRCTVYPNAIKT